jgi:tetratricopeptide (TPR) repeat protein
VVAAGWGIWHALMQTYGFLRIYGGKAGESGRWGARLDWAVCVAWFGGAVFLSDSRLALLLEPYYAAGGWPMSAASVTAGRTILLAALMLLSFWYAAHEVWRWRTGHPVSGVKLVLLITSIGFYWYTNVGVQNILVGLAMFELFHDVQYLAIVWVMNRNRVAQGASVGALTRFLFRNSGALAGTYVALILMFGGLRYVEHGLWEGSLRDVLTGLLALSGILHFYYDGFIWKVSQRDTRQSLEMDPAGTRPWRPTPAVVHAFKWGLLAVPFVALARLESFQSMSDSLRAQRMAETLPHHAPSLNSYGFELHQQGDITAAISLYRRAIAADQSCTMAHINLAAALRETGNLEKAVHTARLAVRLEPHNAHAHLQLGQGLAALQAWQPAERSLRAALAREPNLFEGVIELGIVLVRLDKPEESEQVFRRAIELRPDQPAGWYNLGNLLASRGQWPDSADCYRRVVELHPGFARAEQKLRAMAARLDGSSAVADRSTGEDTDEFAIDTDDPHTPERGVPEFRSAPD